MRSSNRARRSALLAAAIGLAAAALVVGALPATAATTPAAADRTPGYTPGPITHPGLDHAGSEVAKHEGGSAAPSAITPNTLLNGMDVSGYQGNVNWSAAKANGGLFAYVKATEGTGYINGYFAQQYNGSYNVGMIRGAYHFALPDRSGGATQADYFVSHGGGWSRDGKTLPPMLDIEYNPYGSTCYGYSQSGMRSWIQSFSNEMVARTGRYPTVYTTLDWWTTCTGNWGGLGSTNPLFIARYSSGPGTLPAGWGFWTFWQYADHGIFPGDQDYFNGPYDRLVALANG
ncbi:hypothetical protein F0L68_27785 [Solihabitans fulvus]|uniref:Lysozyme n=1 Tax=Solihabitans fulvus TaxID=1892852 RepID=A0A5B2WVJ2_9PSEU|nr:lysozyme [Solihabitans fulvus]KAA2255983.1 hypothetical protein F0L68_27785 [Solihabitans fulvus]